MNRKKLRGVMIGSGHFAEIQLEAWMEVKGGGIFGLMDLDINKSNALGQKYGINVYDHWEQLIENVQPDFIDICTPPDTHYHYAKLAADLNIPVLCQKPLAPTFEEGIQLIFLRSVRESMGCYSS